MSTPLADEDMYAMDEYYNFMGMYEELIPTVGETPAEHFFIADDKKD
jgi:hypothetical protein